MKVHSPANGSEKPKGTKIFHSPHYENYLSVYIKRRWKIQFSLRGCVGAARDTICVKISLRFVSQTKHLNGFFVEKASKFTQPDLNLPEEVFPRFSIFSSQVIDNLLFEVMNNLDIATEENQAQRQQTKKFTSIFPDLTEIENFQCCFSSN